MSWIVLKAPLSPTNLQCRLVVEQQLGDSVVEDKRLVGRVNDARQVDAYQQNVSCSFSKHNTSSFFAVLNAWFGF